MLGTKRRAECIYFRQCQSEGFGFELTTHGQVSRPGEKIFRVIDLAARRSRFGSRWIESRNAKQFSGSLAIASGDDGRLDINETEFLKKLVHGKRKTAAHPKNAAEEI